MKTLLFWLCLTLPVWADQVCLEKVTGKLLEYQSHATPGTCTQNLVGSGVNAATIEETEVTEQEWELIRREWIEQPAKDAALQREQARQAKAQALQQKLGLTAKEFEDLRDALR